jgi:hypothetical protein
VSPEHAFRCSAEKLEVSVALGGLKREDAFLQQRAVVEAIHQLVQCDERKQQVFDRQAAAGQSNTIK